MDAEEFLAEKKLEFTADERIESLKCCGNCKNYDDSICFFDQVNYHERCDDWQWDGLTADLRMKEKKEIK